MAHTACLVCLVSTYSGWCKNTLWKASSSSGLKTKQADQQGRLVDEAGRLTGQSGLPILFQTCLICFMPATSALVFLKWMFHKLICVQQSTFLRYLWISYGRELFCLLPKLLFLLQPLTVLMKQKRQAVRAIQQSILLRCLWPGLMSDATSLRATM